MNDAVESRPSSTDLMASFDEAYDFSDVNYSVDTSKLRCDEKTNGFDNNVGDSWIYPTNYPVREYQYEITKVSLYQNTLVSTVHGRLSTSVVLIFVICF